MKAGPSSITYISVMTANLQQAICSSLRCFSCGTPSRRVTLRNVAAVSRLAEQTPQRPCLPSLLTSLPFSFSSFCAAEHHSWFLCRPPEGYWVMFHRQEKKTNPLEIFWTWTTNTKEKLFFFFCAHSCLRKRWKRNLGGHVTERICRIIVDRIRSFCE